jgi:HNH endonuclease
MDEMADEPWGSPGSYDLPLGGSVTIERDLHDESPVEAVITDACMARMRARVPGTLEFLTVKSRQADADRVVSMLGLYRDRLAHAEARPDVWSDELTVRVASIRKDIAVATQLSDWTVAHTLNTAERAERTLPTAWNLFVDGRMPWRNLDIAVQASIGLDPDRLPAYDVVAAERGETELPSELGRHLRDERERLQADTAVERAKEATARRHVAAEPLPDGQAALSLIGPAHEIAAIDDGLTRMAIHAVGADEAQSVASAMYDGAVDMLITALRQGAPDAEADADPLDPAGDGSDVPAGRLTELGRVRVPHRKGIEPQILLTVPQSVATGTENEQGGSAILAGYGVIDPVTARGILGWAKSWTRVLTDPVTGGLIDIDPASRRIPAALARWYQARDEHCRAPGCNRVNCDHDHTEPFAHGGPTAPDNLALLCRSSHRLKHGGLWDMEQLPDGSIRWTSAWGTVWISQPATKVAPAATTRIRPPKPLDADDLD